MKNQLKFLIFVALILGAFYAYRFTDWFAEKEIQIKCRNLPDRSPKSSGEAGTVVFYLEKEYQITSLKVISVDEAATNKYPRALWHLVSDSNSVPVTDFNYGVAIAGMRPKIAGLLPEPLQASGNYRIFIEAGKLKGVKDFQTQRSRGR